MSLGAKMSGRKRGDSHETLDIPDGYTPTYQPDASDQIPFQEFIDNDVNNEKWESTYRASTGAIEKFSDTYSVLLPPSLDGFEWKPIEEIFPNTDFVIKSDSTDFPDLITANKHLLQSEFMRSFISSIEILYHLGEVREKSVEFTSPNFSPAFEKEKWRPWFHIYSNCKSGKGLHHNPTPNKTGKYIVRLFWLGSWKKLYVSDKLPLNINNQLLLPLVYVAEDNIDLAGDLSSRSRIMRNKEVSHTKNKSLQIWPVLLAKALMILASITWTKENELLDFDILQCLTGYISNKEDVSEKDPLEIWETCMQHTFQYIWDDDEKKNSVDKTCEEKPEIGTKSNLKIPSQGLSKKPKSGSRIGGMPKKSFMQIRSKDRQDEVNKNRFVVVLGIELTSLPKEEYLSNDRKWSHEFLVEQTRTVPLLKPSTDEEFVAWKRYRWIDWAIENNLINPRCPPNPIRSLKTVDPFRFQYQHLIPVQESIHTQDSLSQLSSNISKKKHASIEIKDVTQWLDLEHIENLIKYVKVYYMPCSFKSKIRISNLSCENISKEQRYPFAKSLIDLLGLQWKEIIRPEGLQSHRNEPIYVFTDCLHKQSIIINLNQTGNLKTITDRQVEKEIIPSQSVSECGLCTTTFLERVKRNYKKPRNEELKEGTRKSIAVMRLIPNIEHYFPKASILITTFKWDSNRCDDFVTSMKTLGSGCIVLNLKPGRHVFNLWIKVEVPYCVQVVSDSCLCVGTLEETLTLMSKDSLLFREAYWTLVENFLLLIYSFGSPEYMHDRNEFYKCFKPNCEMSKKELMVVEEVFLKEFFETINDTLGSDSLRVVKILLKKWQFVSSYRCDVDDVSGLCYPVDVEDMRFVNIMHQAAIKIQSFFRGLYERLLLSHHDPMKKAYDKTSDMLVKVGERFTYNDRKLGASVLRKFVHNPTIPDLQSKYSWYETLSNDICIAQFVYSSKVTDNNWIFIARHIFFVRTTTPLPIRINIFSNLSQYYIRVFDNDTSVEMKCYANNVAVNEYPPNEEGYTVVAYGWADGCSYAYSKIIFACQEENIEDVLTFSTKTPKKEIISDYYVPNSSDILFRYVLDLKSKNTIITFNLYTDYPKVGIQLRIFKATHPEINLTEVKGTGYVTVPCLALINEKNEISKNASYTEPEKKMAVKSHKKTGKKSKANSEVDLSTLDSLVNTEEAQDDSYYYIIEALIEKNSWPLTAKEWQKVEKERDKLNVQTHHNEHTTTAPTTSKQGAQIRDGPRWIMETYYNNTDFVSFYKDPEKDNLFKSTKLSWYQADPGHYETSKAIRKKFINENLMKNPDLCTDPNVRSLNREIFLEDILPPLDFTPYLKKPLEEVKHRKLKSKTAMWTQNFQLLFNHVDSLIDLDLTDKFREKYFEEETRKLTKINDWFDGIRRESEYMMEQAYKKRERYIGHIKEHYLPSKK